MITVRRRRLRRSNEKLIGDARAKELSNCEDNAPRCVNGWP